MHPAEEETHLLKTLIETIPDMVWLKDPNGVYLVCNPAMMRFMRMTAEQIIGKTDYDFFDRELAELLRGKDKAAIAAGRPCTNEEWVSLPGNRGHILVEATKTPMRDSDGRLIGVLGIGRDISALHMAQEDLQRSEERFRTLALATFEGIVISEKGRIVDCNDQLAKMLGFAREEMLGCLVEGFIAPEYLQEVMSHVQEGRELILEHALLRRDGSRCTVETHGRSMVIGGREMRVTAVRDITELKKGERALRASEESLRIRTRELEETNAALKILLRQREADKRELEEKILSNIRHLVLPYVELMKKKGNEGKDAPYLSIVESNLHEITSSFSRNLSQKLSRLTHREILVANLVREGRQDKEISELLGLSVVTVKAHRRNIREKLGIKGRKTNLRTYLFQLSN